jgi:hypothetical protein
MQKNRSLRFVSPDGKATLTVIRSVGKRGINVRASLKADGDKKAATGCRSTHTTEAEANAAVEALKNATLQRGWTERVKTTAASKQAFTEIPVAPGMKTSAKKSA